MPDELLAPTTPPQSVRSLGLVGNGFDLALGYGSRYSDFREYFALHANRELKHDRVVVDIWEEVDRVAGENWCDFESRLGAIGLPAGISDTGVIDEGDGRELEPLQASGTEYAWMFKHALSGSFTEWVSNLRPGSNSPTDEAVLLVQDSDAVITFNYTNSLEEIFGVPDAKILHVHGTASGGSDPYFGCPARTNGIFAGGSTPTSAAVREQVLKDLIDSLTKNARLHLLRHMLMHCTKLDVVRSYGFSFGPADDEYVRFLVANYCHPGTTWTNYVCDQTAADHFASVMKLLNFTGTVDPQFV